MNNDQNLQPLAFYRLQYALDQVRYWLEQKEFERFVFDPYYPATEDPNRPIYLCCFAQNEEGGYYNSYNPDILEPYPGEVLLLNGPLKLTANLVTKDQMNTLLKNSSSEDNYLLFTPAVDVHAQVYYTITAFQHTATGDVLDSGSIDTNPSPPATAMVESEVE